LRLQITADLGSALHETFLASALTVCLGAALVLLLRVGDAPGLVPLPAYATKPAEDRRARRLDELLGHSTGD